MRYRDPRECRRLHPSENLHWFALVYAVVEAKVDDAGQGREDNTPTRDFSRNGARCDGGLQGARIHQRRGDITPACFSRVEFWVDVHPLLLLLRTCIDRFAFEIDHSACCMHALYHRIV